MKLRRSQRNAIRPATVMLSAAPRSRNGYENPRRGSETSRRCLANKCRFGEFWPRNSPRHRSCGKEASPKLGRENSLKLHLLLHHSRDLSTPRLRCHARNSVSRRSAQDDSCQAFARLGSIACSTVSGFVCGRPRYIHLRLIFLDAEFLTNPLPAR